MTYFLAIFYLKVRRFCHYLDELTFLSKEKFYVVFAKPISGKCSLSISIYFIQVFGRIH